MGKNDQRVEAVLELLRKQAPLSVKQEKFCCTACVERFLKAKGDHVKKAAKSLRACLSWRDSFGIDNLIADEFSAELTDGVAYVAGHDQDSRPILIFRIKQDYPKLRSQKMFTRLVVFTLEVAIGTMPKNVHQMIILFDASFFRSASAFLNLFLPTLKLVADFYPGRLHSAFLIDPPALFSYLWKGVRPFVELSTVTMIISSLDFEDSLDFSDFAAYPRASSLRFDQSTAKIGSSASSRFSFTVSHHFDSLKPWYLSLTDTSASKVGPTSPSPLGPALISPLNARSLSFASPAARMPRGVINDGSSYSSRLTRKSLFPSTPLPPKSAPMDGNGKKVNQPKTPRPSFLQSPAVFFRRECHVSKTEKNREAFRPLLKFYRRPYDEMIYRSKMRPPLGGLISIVTPNIRRRHVSMSQRF
ncbi:phosphatidylinositol transfer protein 3-like [Cucurbita pepo subsp. pepo]|uniref:phosphatidylinositol transfer protein 3-like n=1 Tax=Cucurbita pepo subsp. pepo TaxID=3664 RepID=UPI000C9D32D8|nr:phosphatidylinositol transfer protein 3-like [Cucurbita pepo subsp. pepo]